MNTDEWQPATVEDVQAIVADELSECDAEQLATFRKYAVQPYAAPITRYGKAETVVVVARRGEEVIYYEDVEDGFQVSPVSSDGTILEHWCNQDDLRYALNAWIEGRGIPGRFRPAKPLR